MPYIGRGIETLSDRVVLDSLTASATASYTLQLNSVNFVPSSASSLTVSLNGVIQKPDSSYTVSGSTLTFSSALATSDSIDFIIAERDITLQTPSAGSVNTDQLAASAVTNAKIASNAAIATTKLGTGAILQVQSTLKTDAFSSSSDSTEVDVTGLSVNITPSSSSSKILVMAHVTVNSNGTSGVHFKIKRDSTVVGGGSSGSKTPMGFVTDAGQADGNRANTTGGYTFIDEPSSTSQLTYKVTYQQFNSSNTVKINTNSTVGGDAFDDIFTSGITVMEIAG
jgi:hypothetical protein